MKYRDEALGKLILVGYEGNDLGHKLSPTLRSLHDRAASRELQEKGTVDMTIIGADIEKALLEIFRTDLAVDAPTIAESSHLVGDLGLDSVAFAVVRVAIESRLGVKLTTKELLSCQTVGDVISAVAQHDSAQL